MTNQGRIAKQKSATTNQAMHSTALAPVTTEQCTEDQGHPQPTVNPTFEKSSQQCPGSAGFHVF
jgi:hypothetical protein